MNPDAAGRTRTLYSLIKSQVLIHFSFDGVLSLRERESNHSRCAVNPENDLSRLGGSLRRLVSHKERFDELTSRSSSAESDQLPGGH